MIPIDYFLFLKLKTMKYFCKYLPVEEEITKPTKQKLQLFKLFLCSRDIQIGDGMVMECLTNGNYEIFQIDTLNDIFPDMIKEGSQFKIIGEISPDALSYVKEGDEFDENQVIYASVDYIGWRYKIKGPCGHFH